MYVITTVDNLKVGDRIKVDLGEVYVTHHFKVKGKFSIGQSDGPVIWHRPNTPIEVFREDIQ